MINTIIVEDSQSAIDLLSGMLKDYVPDVKLQGIAQDVKSAFLLIHQVKPDLVFLDIQLKNGTAFDLLDLISNINFEIIFITAYDNYAISAFKHNALHCLVKPFALPDLIEAVSRMKSRRKDSINTKCNSLRNWLDKKITIPTENEMKLIYIKDIKYIKADGSYSIIYLSANKKIIISRLLKDFTNQLPQSDFYRISKSFIINLNYINTIRHIDGGIIEMSDGTKISIPRRKRNDFTVHLMKFAN